MQELLAQPGFPLSGSEHLHAGSCVGDAGLPDGGSSVSGGALGLNGSTNGSSLDCNAGRTGEINPERPVSLNWLSMNERYKLNKVSYVKMRYDEENSIFQNSDDEEGSFFEWRGLPLILLWRRGLYGYPANTRRYDNVVITSKQRCDDILS